MFDHSNYSEVPDYTLQGLDRWAKEGQPPGAFLEAVISNDLEGAIAKADGNNRKVLKLIVRYLWSELPSECYGSEDVLENWEGLKDQETKNTEV